ncbi:MAG: putative toxin-antitoxin system toxin component, PIN family [Blastochloris sp.]|nr:putative toxin-antitoxin system toxin component, PIN family [Blastochloris sp.]
MSKRYVIDTNTFISAVLLPGSIARQALDQALTTGVLLVSEPTILEVMQVITRPKFDRYIPEANRRLVLSLLLRQTTLLVVTIRISDCRDPKDNKFLELARTGSATAIISGDKDLLELHPYHGIAILTPGEFVRSNEV